MLLIWFGACFHLVFYLFSPLFRFFRLRFLRRDQLERELATEEEPEVSRQRSGTFSASSSRETGAFRTPSGPRNAWKRLRKGGETTVFPTISVDFRRFSTSFELILAKFSRFFSSFELILMGNAFLSQAPGARRSSTTSPWRESLEAPRVPPSCGPREPRVSPKELLRDSKKVEKGRKCLKNR